MLEKKIFAAEKKKRNVPMDQITDENVRKSVRKKKIFGVEITKRSDPMDQISEKKDRKIFFYQSKACEKFFFVRKSEWKRISEKNE